MGKFNRITLEQYIEQRAIYQVTEAKMKDTRRYIPIKRTALDGKVWWCVYDTIEKKYSTFICHGRFKTKKECKTRIEYCEKEYGIK